MLRTIIILHALFLTVSLNVIAPPVQTNDENKKYDHQIQASYHFKIIEAPKNTWGYDIIADKKILIHQPNKPGMPGREGFKKKKDAVKVAELVIAKLNKGVIPPTVSMEELQHLDVVE